MTLHRPIATGAILLAAAVSTTACDSLTGADSQLIMADALEARMASGLVFLSMRITPATHMQALFEGRVVEDHAGCLRLDSPDPATVVWPRGTSFDRDGAATRILDADGDLIGRIGESFRLAGGEVDALPDAMGFTQSDRDLAETHCPGKYWIVAVE